jgi:HEAT repeats/NACHT domain
MLVESLLVMGGAELGKQLLKNATEVGGGALKEYLKGFFKGKIGDIVDTFQPELKAAMQKASGEFIKLFVEELRYSGVTDRDIDRYYLLSIESFIKDKETIALLGKAFDAGFKGFDDLQISQIEEIWTVYLISVLTFPVEFDWQLLLDNYEIKVKEIRRADEKLRNILDSETLESIDDGIKKTNEIQKSNAPIPIEFNLDGYRESLQNSYGYLKLDRLGIKGKHNIQLGKIFIERNVREGLPLSRFEIPQHYKQELLKSGQLDRDLNFEQVEQYRRQYLEKSAEPVLKAIGDENCQRAVLLGEPGSGKSSLLQYLALDWAEGKTERFPLLFELREYALDRSGAKNFLDFLSGSARADWKFDRQKLHAYLLHQPSLVMFDGLDEIFDRQIYESIIDEIANFATQQYPNAKIVITSRVSGYNPDRLRGVKFQHFTLQELDESQIHEFIDKSYQLALGEDPQQEQLKQRLKDAIDRSPAIRILANNPLLLTLMATLNQQGSLPTRQVDLYDRASRLLLHNWDFDDKKLADPSLQAIRAVAKQDILGKIAYEMQSKVGLAGNLIDSARLKEILTGYLKDKDFDKPRETATLLVEQLPSRNFILWDRGADTYGFIHRTFLKYFCARDFVRRINEEPYSLEQLRDDVFTRYWQDETWHEVLKLICGLLEPEQAGYLVDSLIIQEVDRANYLEDIKFWNNEQRATIGAVQHLLLATECWAEVKTPKSKLTTEKLKEKLKKEIESQSKIFFGYDAAKLLLDSIAQYYHTEPETFTWLKQIAFNDQHKDVRWAAVESIAQYYHSIPETFTCLQQVALNDQHGWVRRAVVGSISQYYHTEPKTFTWLKQVAFNDQHKDVRWAALGSIAQYYHTEAETFTWLKQVALNDQDEYIRRAALKSIAQYYHSIPESLNCLQQVALHDQDEYVRWAAVESIAQYYHSIPESLNCLLHVALHDRHRDVRRAVVGSIAQHYHSISESLNCLQQVALHDQAGSVRRVVVGSIAKHYHSIPESLNCLQHVALHDQYGWVRQIAVRSIIEYYHSIPESLNCLLLVSLNDQHEDIRRIAVRSIVEYYRSIPEILTWLQQVALNDQHEDVRRIAVRSIAQYYHTEPETLTWLQDIALHERDDGVRRAAVLSIAQYYHTEPESLN